MNKHIFQGEWNLLVGKIQHQWAELTDDDLLKIKADQKKIFGILEKRYGYTKEQAEEAVATFKTKLEKHIEIDKLKHNLSEVAHGLVEKLAEVSGHYVQQGEEEIIKTIKNSPVASTGIALGLGFVLGLLLARK